MLNHGTALRLLLACHFQLLARHLNLVLLRHGLWLLKSHGTLVGLFLLSNPGLLLHHLLMTEGLGLLVQGRHLLV